MRAIKLDAVNQSIEEVDLGDDSLSAMQKIVGGYIERAYEFPNGDEAYCDEEGLLKDPVSHWTGILGAHQPFAGSLVIVGHPDDNGETTEPVSTIEELRKVIYFMQDL